MIGAWALAARADDHAVEAPAAIEVAATAIPDGPPVVVDVAPGQSLAAIVQGLPAGSTVHLLAGRHPGPLVLDRSLSVWGDEGAVIDGGGAGTVVVIAADDVTLRDVRVTGGGFLPQQDDSGVAVLAHRFTLERVAVDHAYLGIDLRRASDGVVRDCRVQGDPTQPFGLRGDGIRLWEAHRNTVSGNTLTSVRDLVVWYSDDNTVSDNVVTASRYGTHLMHSDDTLVRGNRYDGDVVGVFVMYSRGVDVHDNQVLDAGGEAGVGIGLKESDDVRILGNALVGGTTGLYVDTTPQRADGDGRFEGNVIAGNEVGVRFHGPSNGAVFTGNTFVANREQGRVDARVVLKGVEFTHNYWSDYAGYDLDGDGAGDVPFEVRSTAGSLVERNDSVSWLAGTPALLLVDLFGQAFPMFAPPVEFTDAAPAFAPSSSPGPEVR